MKNYIISFILTTVGTLFFQSIDSFFFGKGDALQEMDFYTAAASSLGMLLTQYISSLFNRKDCDKYDSQKDTLDQSQSQSAYQSAFKRVLKKCGKVAKVLYLIAYVAFVMYVLHGKFFGGHSPRRDNDCIKLKINGQWQCYKYNTQCSGEAAAGCDMKNLVFDTLIALPSQRTQVECITLRSGQYWANLAIPPDSNMNVNEAKEYCRSNKLIEIPDLDIYKQKRFTELL